MKTRLNNGSYLRCTDIHLFLNRFRLFVWSAKMSGMECDVLGGGVLQDMERGGRLRGIV